MWRLLNDAPHMLNERQLESLQLGLSFLVGETDVHTLPNAQSGSIASENRPHSRSLSAALAYGLCQRYVQQGKEPPEVIKQWEAIASSDPLPEVREDMAGSCHDRSGA